MPQLLLFVGLAITVTSAVALLARLWYEHPRTPKLEPIAARRWRRRGHVAVPRGEIQTRQQKWELELRRAGWNLQAREFFAIWAGSPVLGALVGLIMWGVSGLVLGAAAGAVLPYWLLRSAQHKRIVAYEKQLLTALSLVAGSLRAGHGLVEAMRVASEELGDPLRWEFSLVMRESQVGVPLPDALQHMYQRVPSPDLDLVITAILIQREVGGNLAEILDTIGETIRERIRLRGEVRTLTTQGRVSAWVVGALPVVLGLILTIMNRPTMMMFFHHPLGRLMLAIGVAMELLGVMVIRRIIAIDV